LPKRFKSRREISFEIASGSAFNLLCCKFNSVRLVSAPSFHNTKYEYIYNTYIQRVWEKEREIHQRIQKKIDINIYI
jgi:hypothetical protein